MTQNPHTLLLVDGTSYLYRAYHALPPLTSPQGEPTGALSGVLNMLRRLRADVPHDYAALVFDAKGKNFRHALLESYKANRPPMPENLRPQAAWVRELAALSGWKVLEVAGVEADDVLATLARRGAADGMRVIVASGDKDMAQLADAQISLLDTVKNTAYGAAGVLQKYGVRPDQIVDFLSLTGDKADNVPGVQNWGEKRAAQALAKYGTLENLAAHAHEIGGKNGGYLREALPRLPLSQQLITLKDDVDLSAVLPQGWADLARRAPQKTELAARLHYFGFHSLLKALEKDGTDGAAAQEIPSAAGKNTFRQPEENIALNYRLADSEATLEELCVRLAAAQKVGFDTETTSLDAQEARLVGMSFAFAAGDAVYVPVAHDAVAAPCQLSWQQISGCLKPFLENAALGKIGQNLKYDRHVLKNHGIDLRGIAGDAMLASYLVESHLPHGLDKLAPRHLGLETTTYEDLCGKGAKQMPFSAVPVEKARDYACQDADFALRLEAHLRGMMNAAQEKLYTALELPVAEILFQMERTGVLIDRAELQRQSEEFAQKMAQLENEAYAAAGGAFNLNSPKQLQEILFTRLGIPTQGVRKTAGGGYSTDESVLEKLAHDYPLPKTILAYRALSKLKSTYTDKLPQLADSSGRVHTTYAQAVAVTGRLASNNPNLQNIPVRSEEGRRVRRAFTAPSGCLIVSADYSQIELRIMAHLAGDQTLIDAFNRGEDIHRRTAAEIFGVLPQHVGSEQRRYAKTINFGLIYGMGQYGLAKSLGIDNAAAKNFIERYFARYPAVAGYMERAKEQAHRAGYVETLFGRRLYLPDIDSKNAARRAAAERAAVNAPMQGTASDLIKRAMIAVAAGLEKDNLSAKLLMQVHDELVLEVPENEVEILRRKLPQWMGGVAELKVPLTVEVGAGDNWEKAH